MKTLATKKVNIAMCWGGLRNTPPKSFPSVGELESTGRILQLLKEAVPDFVAVVNEGEKFSDRAQKKMSDDELRKFQEERQEFIRRSAKLEEDQGNEIISIVFPPDDFNVFFQQFERWGRDWFYKVEPYLDFRKEMCQTNGQPKERKAA